MATFSWCAELRTASAQNPLPARTDEPRSSPDERSSAPRETGRQVAPHEGAQRDPAQRWIKLLGASSYAQRQQAHRELLAMKHEAYDALLDAAEHSDVEIRLAAQSLLEHLQIQWTRSNDPPAIAKLLRGYGDRNAQERRVWIQRLARIETESARVALGRVVRYEPSETLSKLAAVLLLERLPLGDEIPDPRREPMDTSTLARDLNQELRGSSRTGVLWLQAYLQWLESPPEGLAAASALVQEAVEELPIDVVDAGYDREVALSLVRWQARLASASGDTELESLHNLMVNLIGDDERDAKEHVDWLASWQQWPAIIKWSRIESERLVQWPEVMMRVAEAHHRMGRVDIAEQMWGILEESHRKGFEDWETICHSLHAFGYYEGAIWLMARLQSQAKVDSDEAWRTGLDLAHWYVEAGRLQSAHGLLDQLVSQADASTLGWSAIRSPHDRDWIRAERAWLAAQLVAPRNTPVSQLTPTDQLQLAEHLDETLRFRPQDVSVLLRRIECAQATSAPADESLWQERLLRQQDFIEQQIDAAQRDLARFPIASVRLQLERELAEREIELAEILSHSSATIEQAVKLAEHVVEGHDENAIYWSRYAETLARAGRFDAASSALRQALRRAPQAIAWEANIERWNRLAQSQDGTLR